MSGEEVLSLKFRNEPNSLVRARDEVRERLERLGVDETAIHAVDLALEELAGNTIRYGYDGNAEGSIRIELSVSPNAVRIAITDDARPFDPTRHPEPQPSRNLRDAPVGGRGISLVRRHVRALRYRRDAGGNCLEFDVPRVTEPPSAATASGGSSPGSGSTR